MELQHVEKEFKEKVCKEIRFFSEGVDRYRVFTPFQFDDGDSFAIVLKKIDKHWMLSDEGHTYMHLSYEMDTDSLENGNRAKIISNTLSNFGIKEQRGILSAELEEENLGNIFYNFIQGLSKITDITYLNRERVKSTFWEDFKSFVEQKIPQERLKFNYNDSLHDPDAKYPVDCRINKMEKPLFIFAVANDDKCRDSTISILQYEKWGLQFRSLAIFEDQEVVNRKVLARFSDVCEKQYSSLFSNKDRIEKYLKETVV
ncbi:MAG: DUF1828 domain-containing protein [Ignavibacteria bacterium]|nr:DUF1828 domain-containing protein [Ignavibacteria bacterium]